MKHFWGISLIVFSLHLSVAFGNSSTVVQAAPGPIDVSARTDAVSDIQCLPRIAVRAADIPLTITQPGYYYLVEDISGSSNLISIDSSEVTLDLMGHTISGVTDIITSTGRIDITVRNGTVTGRNAIALGGRCRAEHVSVTGCDEGPGPDFPGLFGISVGEDSEVLSSDVECGGASGAGIRMFGGLIQDTSVGARYAIFGGGMRIVRSTIVGLGTRGIAVRGGSISIEHSVLAGSGDIAADISDAFVENSTLVAEGLAEISIGSGSVLRHNSLESDAGDTGKLRIGDNCRIEDNEFSSDFKIKIFGSGNRMERNFGAAEVSVFGTGNYLFNNVVGSYAIAAGNYGVGNLTLGAVPPLGGDTTPPVISALTATSTSSAATITWTTNEAASSSVSYGPTTAYGQTGSSTGLVTSHSVSVSGLSCGTLYNYRVSSADGSNNTSSSPNASFTTTSCPPSGAPISDDFHAPTLNTSLWTVVDPVGSAGVSLSGTNALISLPSGPTRDAWVVNNSVRLLQSVANVNFEVEAKFESAVTVGTQMQGILIEQTPSTFLRFDVYHDGTRPNLFAAAVGGGSGTVFARVAAPGLGQPLWLRVKRVGNSWTYSYSTNGTIFTNVATFSYTLTVAKVGPFAGINKSPVPAPAFTSSIDYFFNTASPIVPEN